MAIRKVLLPLISTGAGEAALSTAWTVAQLWNAHMAVLHVQMDLAPAPAMSAMFQRFTVEHRVKVTEATAGAESATASFLILTGRKLDILPQQARLADLAVVRHPATPEEVSSSDVLHAVLFDSGRPLLIAPQVAPIDASRPAWLCPVIWRIHAACDVFAHRLAVDAELTGDGGGAEPLPVQIQEHHELPKSNHRFAPSRQGSSFGDRAGYSPPS